ncbi:MAG: TadE/TadG family protein [Novosphingobium sp.]
MTQRGEFREGLFKRLIEDRAGNTLAIVAASTLPMMAIIGGGVDISRAYMAKTQLQSACDAGVLAGRRAMSKTSEYGEAEQDKANAMFDFNFDADAVQADDITFESDDNDDGQVLGTATATIPTAIMKIFGKTEIELQVDCMAELQLANVDVMFVLDTTGSMSGTPIQGLRDAVRDFHATLATAVTDAETRVRYGFVPYSTTVNAKELLTSTTNTMPKSYFVDSAPYQTRTAVFEPGYPLKSSDPGEDNTTQVDLKRADCQAMPSEDNPRITTSGTAPSDVTTTMEYWYWSSKKCYKTTKETVKKYEDTKAAIFTKWVYKQVNLDTSNFKDFKKVKVVTNLTLEKSYLPDGESGEYTLLQLGARTDLVGATTSNTTWTGCLEERDTVQTDDFDPVPDDAYDLDINLEPESDATRWKPIWTAIEYYRSAGVTESDTGSKASSPCPASMKLFQTIDLSSTTVPDWLNTYLNNLSATGNTYHDIGMIWGGRLGSTRGIFADNVNEGFDDGSVRSVSRHMIFMTDGKMEPNRTVYTAYGTEQSDNRIAPAGTSNSDLAAVHTLRFRAACDAAKAEGYIVYVVAFGTTVTDDLKYCSSDNRWYYSSNTESLRNTFQFIASQVADLRLGA